MYNKIVSFIREQFRQPEGFIPLHEPRFVGKEREYVLDTIDSTFVSSVGAYVNRFEEMMAEYTGAKYAIATVNGTAALHMALIAAGVEREDEVLTQGLSFVATANAITYTGAQPVFLDVDRETLGLSPKALAGFMETHAEMKADGFCYNKTTGRRIKACVPMHTFGFPVKIDEILEICKAYNIALIEDAAESVGSYYKNRHTGNVGLVAAFSFNGNKTITCGGGGAIVTNDEALAKKLKHLTTTAKVPHAWEFFHDEVGYNYRLPNLNAALACAQLEQLKDFVENKRELAHKYQDFFKDIEGIRSISEPENSHSNYWLNALILEDRAHRDEFLKEMNERGIMTRPIWTLLNKLPMYKHCQSDGLENAQWLEDRVVNIPSSVRIQK